MSGWIRLARGWRDNEVFDDEPLTQREAWIWLIEKAAWKTCTRRNAKGERITAERGQFHTSLRNLGKAWGWGKNRVARFLELLQEHEMIGTVAGQSGMLITICNYAKYQDKPDSQEKESGTAAGQSRDTQEQGKQDIPSSNEEGASPDQVFWQNAKAYLGRHVKNPGALIGRWCRDHGKEDAARAIGAAQVAGAVDPVPYIVKALQANGQRQVVIGI
jgi:hypothetical protein